MQPLMEDSVLTALAAREASYVVPENRVRNLAGGSLTAPEAVGL
jgi:hypothetical protein